ncbi:MAG: hypothetical protein ABDH28_03350 [Brevinematia bacterium]
MYRFLLLVLVTVIFLSFSDSVFPRTGARLDSLRESASSRADFDRAESRIKDYDADPTLVMRPYEELKAEIKENILSIGVFGAKKKKIVIYIWDFENRSGYRVGASKIKDDISVILLETGRFRLVEDSIVEVAMKEMNLSATGFIDQNNIKELGKRLGIEYMMFGTINNNPLAGGEPNISIVLKLIDVETTQIVWAYEVGMNRRNFKTSVDAVIEEGILKNENSFAKEWDKINEDAIRNYGKPITSISVFFINTGKGIDDSAVVDKMISALVQAKIPGVKVIDRANLSRIIEQIKKEGYEESAFFRTKKEFGKFYSVDSFLYGVITKEPATGKVQLNLKLGLVESVTADWGRVFFSQLTPAERESIGKVQQREFSEGVSKTVGTITGAVGEFLGFILSAPGVGMTVDFGWLGGFTTPGMTLKENYNGYDIFEDQILLACFNATIEFFRIRFWKGWYLESGIKVWAGFYAGEEDDYYYDASLVSAEFNGFVPSLGIRYVNLLSEDERFFFKASILPLVEGISVISSKVDYYYYSYYGRVDESVSRQIPSGNYSSPLNWPFEFEVGVMFEDMPFYWTVILGLWFPDRSDTSSVFEWEFGINIRVPVVWWHPFSLLYDKYLYD